MLEYGAGLQKWGEYTTTYTSGGWKNIGNGVRIDLDSYKDFVM